MMLIMDLLLDSVCVLWTRFHRMELHGRQCPCKSFRDGLSNTISVLHILIPLYNDDYYNSEFLKITYSSQELILRMFIISKYLILFTTYYNCISVILVTKLCMIIQSIKLALHIVLYMYIQHVCSIIYECYPKSYSVSSLSVVECNIIYWRPLAKRIIIVLICHIIYAYRPTYLLNELNAHYITIVKFYQAYQHVCHVQLIKLSQPIFGSPNIIYSIVLTGMHCNLSGYLKTLITCNLFTQMKGCESKQYIPLYIPICILVSSRKIHLKYSFKIIYRFMIWCTVECLSTSSEIIEVKPTCKLIELLMLCGCCMLYCTHPCLIICTLIHMQIGDNCVLQMVRHYILCLCILLVFIYLFIYKNVHVFTRVDIVAFQLGVTFYETLLQLLSILRIYDGLQSFNQSTLIGLHVHVPGIFRQVTLHRIILRSHRENIARYFNESEVMMYLHHELIIYTTGIHAMCPNLFNIPVLTKIRSTLFIHYRNYWYSNKLSNYFESIYIIILQTFLILLHISPLVDNSNLRRLLYLYMYTCSLVVVICYANRPVCQILIHIYNSSKDNSYRQLLCAIFKGHFLYIYNFVNCHCYYSILFHFNAGLACVHLTVNGGILLSLLSKIQINVLNTYLLTLAVHLKMFDVMEVNMTSNAKYLNIWKLYILYAHSLTVHNYSKNIAITSVKTVQLNTYFIDHNSSLCVNDMVYFLIHCAIFKHYHIVKTMVLIITHTIPECILNLAFSLLYYRYHTST